MEIIFDFDELDVDGEAVMFVLYQNQAFPGEDWECYPLEIIKDLLAGVVDLWLNNHDCFESSFMGKMAYDSEFPLDISICKLESKVWLMSLGQWSYDKNKMEKVTYMESGSDISIIRMIYGLASAAIECIKKKGISIDYFEIERLLKSMEDLNLPVARSEIWGHDT